MNAKEKTAANKKAALALASAGIPVFPAEIVIKCDKDPVKKPCILGWQQKATTSKAQIQKWFDQFPHAVPGIPTGSSSGIAVLDVDRKKGKDGFAELKAMGLKIDNLSPVQGESPGGSRHVFLKHKEGLRSRADVFGPGLDVRGESGFVVAPGSVTDNGNYKLLMGKMSDELPDWPTTLTAPSRRMSNTNGAKTGLPFEEFSDALLSIANDGNDADSANYDWWVKMLAAIHCETDGSEKGLELAQKWSSRHPDYDPDLVEGKWFSFHRNDATGATVLWEARKGGWHNTLLEDRLLNDCFTCEEMMEIDPQFKAVYEKLVGTPPRPDTPKDRLTFLSPADCEDLPLRLYVVKGLLAVGDVGTIVGAPGTGKSLLAPYLGYSVARGEMAFGRRTRQGGVFYVAAEDEIGMRGRVSALREKHGEADGFRLVAGVSDLLKPNSPDLKELKNAAKRERPLLIVIDTIAIAFPGLEENDATSMGKVVSVARDLTKWGAAVLLIHHDTKAGDGLPRGHSILNGALDMNLCLKRDNGAVMGTLTKNRNGSTDEKLAFTVETIPLGEDEDGDAISTAICREGDATGVSSKEAKLPKSAKALLKVFQDLNDGGPVSEDRLRNEAVSGRNVSTSEKRDSRSKAFNRAMAELINGNVLVFRDGHYTIAESPEAQFTDGDV